MADQVRGEAAPSAHGTDRRAARRQGVLPAWLREDLAEAAAGEGPGHLGRATEGGIGASGAHPGNDVGGPGFAGGGRRIGAQIGAANPRHQRIGGRPLHAGIREQEATPGHRLLGAVGRPAVARGRQDGDAALRRRDEGVPQGHQGLDAAEGCRVRPAARRPIGEQELCQSPDNRGRRAPSSSRFRRSRSRPGGRDYPATMPEPPCSGPASGEASRLPDVGEDARHPQDPSVGNGQRDVRHRRDDPVVGTGEAERAGAGDDRTRPAATRPAAQRALLVGEAAQARSRRATIPWRPAAHLAMHAR